MAAGPARSDDPDEARTSGAENGEGPAAQGPAAEGPAAASPDADPADADVVTDDLAGLQRPPRVAGIMAAYGAARLGLFALATLLLRLVGLAPLTAVVMGALVSVVLSWPLLARQRMAVAAALAARRQTRRSFDWADPSQSDDGRRPS